MSLRIDKVEVSLEGCKAFILQYDEKTGSYNYHLNRQQLSEGSINHISGRLRSLLWCFEDTVAREVEQNKQNNAR